MYAHSSSFFFNDTATTEIYTLSLHDALPICHAGILFHAGRCALVRCVQKRHFGFHRLPDGNNSVWSRQRNCFRPRSEEHTSELQSLRHLVCRLLLEKKKIACAHALRGICPT